MSEGTLFQYCAAKVAVGIYTEVLECVSDRLEEQAATQRADINSWLLVLAGALVFFMQAGFAMLCGGCVRKKNLQNTMLKNLLDACGAAIAFHCVGYAFAFGGQNDRTDITFVGVTNFFGTGEVDQAFWFFEYAFSATCVTIVAGTLAERCQMVAYLFYSVFLTGFVYPVVVHSIWSNNGFLSAFSADPLWGIGCIDFAGSGVVHLTGGTTALSATMILGARKGRFHDSRGRVLPTPTPFPGHSIALQLMGTMVLWFGCKYILGFDYNYDY
jgi:Amt family ammonium transporter